MAWESPQNFRSMTEALPMVKEMINDLVKNGTKIPTWVLTYFKDPEVKFVKKTEDPEELKRDIDALKHNGRNILINCFIHNNECYKISIKPWS